MVAYFRRQNYSFMSAGAAIGLGAAMTAFPVFDNSGGNAKYFLLVLATFAGVVSGRMVCSIWANKKLKAYQDILYLRGEPDEFLAVYEPLVKGVPINVVEHVDGMCKIAYAYEAKGEYDRALKVLRETKPGKLRLHGLVAAAMVASHRTRLELLKRNMGEAENCMEGLIALGEAAAGRAPAVAASIGECVRLYEIWAKILRGEGVYATYLEEEVRLAKNQVHKGEILLLLYENAFGCHEPVRAIYLAEAAGLSDKLYTTKLARRLKEEEVNDAQ